MSHLKQQMVTVEAEDINEITDTSHMNSLALQNQESNLTSVRNKDVNNKKKPDLNFLLNGNNVIK